MDGYDGVVFQRWSQVDALGRRWEWPVHQVDRFPRGLGVVEGVAEVVRLGVVDTERGQPEGVLGVGEYPGERFFGQSDSGRVHVIEFGWLGRLRSCRLYACRRPAEPFRPHRVGGYWVAGRPVDAIERVSIDDPLGRHATR